MYSFRNASTNTHAAQNDAAQGTWYAGQEQGVSVHTGFPNPAIDARLQGLDLNQLLVRNSASTFLLRVAGQDWQFLGIFHDDIVVVDRSLAPHRNDLVMWWYDGDFTISEFCRMRAEAQVWGVVTATIHQFCTKGGQA